MTATEPFDEVWRTWHSYIRHYTTADNTVVVRCNEEEIPYGYHYVNRDILVKTPLTHLAYQTSMAATKAGVVFAHGPAGTGKTETQKDFAQIELGYPSYVFNCSEKMDETSFMKIREAAEALPHAMFIFDEANCCQRELLEEFVAAMKVSSLGHHWTITGPSLDHHCAETRLASLTPRGFYLQSGRG